MYKIDRGGDNSSNAVRAAGADKLRVEKILDLLGTEGLKEKKME